MAAQAGNANELVTKELSSLINASRQVTSVEGSFARSIHRSTYLAAQKDLRQGLISKWNSHLGESAL